MSNDKYSDPYEIDVSAGGLTVTGNLTLTGDLVVSGSSSGSSQSISNIVSNDITVNGVLTSASPVEYSAPLRYIRDIPISDFTNVVLSSNSSGSTGGIVSGASIVFHGIDASGLASPAPPYNINPILGVKINTGGFIKIPFTSQTSLTAPSISKIRLMTRLDAGTTLGSTIKASLISVSKINGFSLVVATANLVQNSNPSSWSLISASFVPEAGSSLSISPVFSHYIIGIEVSTAPITIYQCDIEFVTSTEKTILNIG